MGEAENNDALEGACHCGSVRFTLLQRPRLLVKCNCSICRRLGALWAYGDRQTIKMDYPKDATRAYMWGDKKIEFHFCKACGCTTHYQTRAPEETQRIAANGGLLDQHVIGSIPLRHFDGADTWKFLD